MNRYFFERCFDPTKDNKAYEYFLEYLLMSFSRILGGDGERHEASIESFTRVLDRKMLTTYWRKHARAIHKLDFRRLDRRVVTANYTASYTEDLDSVYNVLNQLVARTEKQ